MTYKTCLKTACVSAALACALSAPVRAQLITNGGFESGLAGWTTADQVGSDGSFFAQTGTTSPLNGFAVPAPPEGTRAAMTDAGAGGSHVLYQDFTVPNNVTLGTVGFSLYLNNAAGAYFTPAHLDWAATSQAGGTILNQQARVDIITTSADPFSVAGGSVLQNLFQTTALTPPVMGYNPFLIDITALLQAHLGETLRLRFAETDNVNFFNLGVDNVSLTPEAGTLALLLVGGALVVSRSRRARGAVSLLED